MSLLAFCDAVLTVATRPVNPYDQSQIPIEADTHDPRLVKIVLVAGTPSHAPGAHEYLATQAVLRGLLQQTPGIFPVIVRDNWPRDPKLFERARAIVWYTDGASHHPLSQPEHAETIQRLVSKGVGFVAFHYPLNVPKELAPRALAWWGGYFDPELSGGSGAIHWAPRFELPAHPITRGVTPF